VSMRTGGKGGEIKRSKTETIKGNKRRGKKSPIERGERRQGNVKKAGGEGRTRQVRVVDSRERGGERYREKMCVCVRESGNGGPKRP